MLPAGEGAMIRTLSVETTDQGLHEITDRVAAAIAEALADANLTEGLATLFLQHTSASLVIQENADPSARRDLERWLARLAPEDDPLYTHTLEGPDDMPSHIRAVLTATSLSIPIVDGKLALGSWQGIFLWEHRRARHTRKLVVHVGS
jgi:secondary thiamine-phosphate synthase enzyme